MSSYLYIIKSELPLVIQTFLAVRGQQAQKEKDHQNAYGCYRQFFHTNAPFAGVHRLFGPTIPIVPTCLAPYSVENKLKFIGETMWETF